VEKEMTMCKAVMVKIPSTRAAMITTTDSVPGLVVEFVQ